MTKEELEEEVMMMNHAHLFGIGYFYRM